MQKNTTLIPATPRKPLKKLTQLNEKEQFHFVELFHTHKYVITEKVDGFALRLYFDGTGEMLFESAYSELTEPQDFVFPKIATELYMNNSIKNIFDYPIKLVGELVYLFHADIINDSITFAPVCTRYSISESVGGSYFVIFDMYKVKDNTLIKLTDDEYRVMMNNIIMTSALFGKDILQYIDGKQLKYNFKKIESENFNEILKSLVEQTDSLKSHLCNANIESPIEGIVITFDTGEQYGVFSSKYKLEKEKYYVYFKEAEDIEKNFKKLVYGYSLTSAIKKHNAHLTKDAKEKYNKNLIPCFYALIDKKNKIYNAANNDIIPRTCGMFQEFLIFKKAEKLMKNNYMSYIDPNLCDFNLSTQN